MSRLLRYKKDDDGMGIDLTPMLDVVFIMLIFFIVTASFVKEVGIDITRQEPAATDAPSDNKNIILQVMANNEVWLDGRRIDIRSVRANVERLHAQNPKASVIIQADPQSTNNTLTQIADQAREANVYDVSLVISR